MNNKKSRGFTIIEVVIALFIFIIISTAVIGCLKFALDIHHFSRERYIQIVNAQEVIDDIIIELKTIDKEQINKYELDKIIQKYSNISNNYVLEIQGDTNDLYEIKILFSEKKFEDICTQVLIQ